MAIEDEIKQMTEVEVLEHVAMHFIGQADAIQKQGGDPGAQEQLAARLRDLAKTLKAFIEPDD